MLQKNLLQRRQVMYFEMIDTKHSFTAYVVMYQLITKLVFGLEHEDVSFDCSNGFGTSSPSR